MPSSSTSILTPVSSMMPRMTLPPGPMMSRILSGWICRVTMRGACATARRAAVDMVLAHVAEDVQPALAGLVQRLLHDLAGDAADLDVHLQRGDARRRCRRP